MSAERWVLETSAHRHEVTIAEKGFERELTWLVDGEPAATKKTSGERVTLTSDEHAELGAIGVRLPTFTGPARQVTWYETRGAAETRLGGTDLDPAPGTAAAKREAWIREHPHLHTVKRTAAAAAGIVVPALVFFLLSLVPWPDIDLPGIDLPRLPLPDIDLPVIDLPNLPWPDWNLPDLPPPVRAGLAALGPLLIAFVVARGEVRRRARQDQRKRESSSADRPLDRRGNPR